MIILNLCYNLSVPIKQPNTNTLADIGIEECLHVKALLIFSTEHQRHATLAIINHSYKAVEMADLLCIY